MARAVCLGVRGGSGGALLQWMRGAGALAPANRLPAAAPAFFAVADEFVDATRQLVAEFVDVCRHRVVVGRFRRSLWVRLCRVSCVRLFQWKISRRA